MAISSTLLVGSGLRSGAAWLQVTEKCRNLFASFTGRLAEWRCFF
jgi:hypothetical protein